LDALKALKAELAAQQEIIDITPQIQP